jgi:hypothetical protein
MTPSGIWLRTFGGTDAVKRNRSRSCAITFCRALRAAKCGKRFDKPFASITLRIGRPGALDRGFTWCEAERAPVSATALADRLERSYAAIISSMTLDQLRLVAGEIRARREAQARADELADAIAEILADERLSQTARERLEHAMGIGKARDQADARKERAA